MRKRGKRNRHLQRKHIAKFRVKTLSIAFSDKLKRDARQLRLEDPIDYGLAYIRR